MVLCNVYAVYIKIMNNENQTIHKFDFNLNWYGWNDKLSQLKQESLYSTLPHGRISIVHRTCYEVVSENGLFQCELTGNMMYGKSDAELPCTGDWVLFQPFDENKGIIVGETVVFVGSSGVGKSSLVNALCEKSVLLTSDISLSTGKGRHTSTRREMVLMNDSGVLIDTPGVREFGLVIDNPDSLAEVLEISDYAESCRFKDCKHINEPGCAVLEAVNSGVLDYKVYASYLKLRREAWHFSASEHEKRKKEKSFTKLVEEVKNRKANR